MKMFFIQTLPISRYFFLGTLRCMVTGVVTSMRVATTVRHDTNDGRNKLNYKFSLNGTKSKN